MNSKKIGDITEMETKYAFLKAGYNVLSPYGDCERYDYVVDMGKKFIRIQSKTSTPIDDGAVYAFSCRSSNRKGGGVVHRAYSKNEIDYFATMINGKCHLVPVEECSSDKRLRVKPPKRGQKANISWAKDYEIDAVLKKIENDMLLEG